MLSQCTRDFEPYNDNLFLCPCLALGFPHCTSSQRGSFLFQFSPVYYFNFKLALLFWVLYGVYKFSCTFIFNAARSLYSCSSPRAKGLFFFLPYPDVVGFHHWVSPHCALGFCSLGQTKINTRPISPKEQKPNAQCGETQWWKPTTSG